MEKKYKHEEENSRKNELRESAIEYYRATDLKFSPPLTEEELKDALTTEQVQVHLHDLIDKLYGQ